MRGDGSVNEKEFTDWTRPIVHVNGNLGSDSIRPITVQGLGEIYMSVLSSKIAELRETAGNNEAATGNTPSGVTAASAIAALQEAAGKTSRSATLSAYRAYSRVISQVIELIRQFYDLPRQFRITGRLGEELFVSYSNENIKAGYDENDIFRSPVFDIKVSAQRKNVYSKVQQNELALELYKNGCFNPELADQAVMLLDTMDFDGRERIMRRLLAAGGMDKRLDTYRQIALTMAQKYDSETYERLLAEDGGAIRVRAAKKEGKKGGGEPAAMTRARKRARQAAFPG